MSRASFDELLRNNGVKSKRNKKSFDELLESNGVKSSRKTTTSNPSRSSSGSAASSSVKKIDQVQQTAANRAGITSESNIDSAGAQKQSRIFELSKGETNAEQMLDNIKTQNKENYKKNSAQYMAAKTKGTERTSVAVQKEIDDLSSKQAAVISQRNNGKNTDVMKFAVNPELKATANQIQKLYAEKETLEKQEEWGAMSSEELTEEAEKIKKSKDEQTNRYTTPEKVGNILGTTSKVVKNEYKADPEKKLHDYDGDLRNLYQTANYKSDKDKFYSMSDEERILVSRVSAKESGYDISDEKYNEAIKTLKSKYGYSDRDIVTQAYYWDRYANQKKAQNEDVRNRVFADNHPILSSVASVPLGMAGGVFSGIGIAESYGKEKKLEKIGIETEGIDPNNKWSRLQRASQSIRDEVAAKHIDSDIGDFVYSTAMSGVDSLATGLLPGGSVILGVNAATAKTNELAQRGISSEKAIVGGIASGVFEALFESVSIGNFKALQEVSPKGFKDVALNIAKSMGVNASEEAATEAANIIYDTVANGELSEYSMQIQKLVNSGVPYKDAQKQVLLGQVMQTLEAGAAGALMGVGFGAGGSAIGGVKNAAVNTALKNEIGSITQGESRAELIVAGKAAPEGSKANKLASKAEAQTAKKGKASDYGIGKLAFESMKYGENSGRFSDVKSETELEERYQNTVRQLNEVMASNPSELKRRRAVIDKEYQAAKTALNMRNAGEKAKTEFAQREKRRIDETDRLEISHPEITTENGTATIDGGSWDEKKMTLGEFKGIFKDKDGDNAVKTTNGEEIKLSQAIKQMSDKTASRVYEAANKLSAEAANLFIENYDGDDISEYERAFDYYYKMGRAAMSVSDIRRTDGIFGTYLSADAQEQIATAGLKDREFKAGVTNLSVTKKDSVFKVEREILQEWGEKRGIEFILLDENSDINGKYLTGTNRIVLYRNAEGNILLRTAGHEAFHFIADNSKAEAEQLRATVLEALQKNGVDIEEALKKYADKYEGRESQIDELVADSMFDVFTNKAAVERLAKENSSLARRLVNKLKDVLELIRKKISLLGIYTKPEIEALSADAEAMENIVNIFHDALEKAGKSFNQQNSQKDAGNGQKNNAADVAEPNAVYSFADAKRTKTDLITQAEEMEKDGATKDEIWKKLGIIRDASGIWVYEIDDSEMKIYPNGDARLRNEEGYKRRNKLFEKAFINGEQLTEAEQKEYGELNRKYSYLKKISIFMNDFVSHDELFKAYPELQGAAFGFDDLKSKGIRGYYDQNTKEIILDESLKKEINSRQLGKTAIHEIQHAIQHFDGRAGGANIEYWETQMRSGKKIGINDRKIERVRKKRGDVFNMMSEKLKQKVRRINQERIKAINSGDFDLFDKLQTNLLDNDETGLYREYNNYMFEENYLTDNNPLLSPRELYKNTAGEIEARETADRLKMTAAERTEKMPDLGWERAVFAGKSKASYDIVFFDNGMSYVKSTRKIISGSDKSKWRQQISSFFKKALSQSKEIKINTFEGDTLVITEDTAKKARDINVTENGVTRPLTDNEFHAKLEAESHIDELAEISTKNNKNKPNVPDTKNHPFAKDGFTYRTAYFEDADGQYYKITISVGENGNVSTIYNVGKTKKDSMPNRNIVSAIGSKADILSTDSISEDSESVNKKFSYSYKETEKNIDTLKSERAAMTEEYRNLKAQISEKKSSAEYIAFDDEIKKIRKNGSLFGGFEAVAKVRNERKKWSDESGLTELQDRYSELSEKIHDYDLEIYKLEKAEKEAATIAMTEKVKAFSNSDITKYHTAATKKFGTTNSFDNAGYLMGNGKLLDFSDGQGYRVLDHREIKNALDFLPEGHNYSDGLIQFMNMGNIRMQIGGIDISKAPNEKQIPVLRKFFDQNNGEITVDFSKENGDNAGSIEYPKGTSSVKILNDIKKYFETGKLPQISTAAAFHSMYSTKDTNPIQAHYAEVLRENRNLKQIISALDEMNYGSVRGNIHLDGRDIFRIAGKLLTQTSSQYDRKTLADELTVIYDFMANSGKTGAADSEAIYTSFLQLANRVLEQSKTKDSELWEQYKDVREYLRTQAIYITPQVKKEIISQFGEYRSFRNLLMGKMNRISTTNAEARTLDEVWQELSEKAPEYFPKDANELDMPMYLTAFFDAIAPKVVNPYEHYSANIEEEAALLATNMFEEYFKVGRNKTDKEKYRDLVFENMQRLSESKKALKAEFKKKAAEDEQRHFDNYRTRVEEYKKQREAGDRRRRLRNELERNYNYINRRIVRETDKDHIPENIKPLAEAFKGIVPDGNGTFSRLKFAAFENEYRKLQDTSPFFDEDMADKIGELNRRLTSELTAPRKRDLDNYELETLRDISEHIKHIVQNENRLFSDRLKGRYESYAQRAHGEMQDKGESLIQGISDFSTFKEIWQNKLDSFMKGLIKPEYLFGSLGSDTLKSLYDEIRRGENTEAKILFDARAAEQEIKKKNHYDTRWETQTVTLKFPGKNLTITVEQAMSLYASSKRKQGREHILNGGVILYTSKEIIGKNGKKTKENKRERFIFKEQDIITLQNALTADQKNYVDDMVKYITKDIGSMRNEVSMKLYGIEKYKEKYYYPIKVDKHFLDTNLGKQEVVSTVKNQSSSKRTTAKAHNPIEISGFTDTVNNHIYDSALYCAYVLPVEDFKRVYNYRDKVSIGEGVSSLIKQDISIKEDIRRTKGVNAIREIESFMVALDSGSRYENVMPVSAKLAARMKKTAVMANLSVVVQQPSAVFRSMLYISPKHFATWATKADIAEMKKWNGCALKKEIGYFDVNMGRTATDFIGEYNSDKLVKSDWSAKDYLHRMRTNGMQKIDEIAGWGASRADEMTWGAIWNACKKQTKAENPSLSGDELNAAASELFQKVISKTQVYDSVFTKPEYMRRKEGFAMMATQFMSEPLTSLNMLAEALTESHNAPKNSAKKKEAQKFCARAFGCYVTSIVVNSALKSLVYTLRDDDEEKSFLEKYVANVVEGIATDPIGMFPYVKDILSIVQGYDLNRTDVAVFSSFKDAVDSLGSEKKTPFEKIMAVLKAAGQASGIPAYAVMRDGAAILNIFNKIVDGVQNGFEPTTGKGVLNELKETFGWLPGVEADSSYDQLYKAVADGDTAHYNKVYNNLINGGKNQNEIDNGLAESLEKNDARIAEIYLKLLSEDATGAARLIGEIENAGFSEAVINQALKKHSSNLTKKMKDDPRIEQAALARYNFDNEEYERIIDELVNEGYSRVTVMNAIDGSKIELEKETEDFTIEEKEAYTASYDLRNAIINGNNSNIQEVYNKLAEDMGEEDANNEVWKQVKKAYKNDSITKTEATKLLEKYSDEETEENDIQLALYEAKSPTETRWDKIDSAIENGGAINVNYLLDLGVEESKIKTHIISKYKPELMKLSVGTDEYNELYEKLIDAYVAAGDSEAKAKKKIKDWYKED